jgi:hypothetical protein
LEYASRFGLDVQKLYQLRKPLVRKAALGPARSEAKEPRRADDEASRAGRVAAAMAGKTLEMVVGLPGDTV